MHHFKRFITQNAISLSLFALFIIFFFGLLLTGASEYNAEQKSHHQKEINIREYAVSSHFGEAVFENWESEFLQMWALVIMTIFLKQKGSPDSKKLRGKEDVDTSSKYSILKSFAKHRNRGKAIEEFIYSNSLGLALFILFAISFIIHGFSGARVYNEEAVTHGDPTITYGQYFLSTRFWFESFQNWQSEFLSVAALLTLSIFLRQRGSPESKPIGQPNSRTGKE